MRRSPGAPARASTSPSPPPTAPWCAFGSPTGRSAPPNCARWRRWPRPAPRSRSPAGPTSSCAALALEALPELTAALTDAGLVAPQGDDRRNVVVGPTAGIDGDEVVDPRPLARAVAGALAALTGAVAPKFGVLLDGGGRVHLRARRHAVALGAVRLADGTVAWEVVVDGALPSSRPPGAVVTVVPTEDVVTVVTRAGRGRGRRSGRGGGTAGAGGRGRGAGLVARARRPGAGVGTRARRRRALVRGRARARSAHRCAGRRPRRAGRSGRRGGAAVAVAGRRAALGRRPPTRRLSRRPCPPWVS